jgi:hypothetical protein
MLFRETVAVYCENRTEHTNTLCAQNIKVLNVKPDYIFNHCAVEGKFPALRMWTLAGGRKIQASAPPPQLKKLIEDRKYWKE